MGEGHDLLELMREGLAEGERLDRDMVAAGWRLTRDIYLRAFLELAAAGLPDWSRFFIRGGRLFGGGELLHQQHPDMPIWFTAWDDIWLPPALEVTEALWQEVVRLALEHPDRFHAALKSIQEADLAFDTCPP